ncbi:hypothetical protein [Pseudomonas phage vB_Pae-PA152]|uniref:Uncharacterized protein n=1 Tax=Pseudomonas phage vB_Pae_AM.P2 TaxID=2731695 RepID=A0A7S5W9A7_9CAUD|nr:hypothetical protein AMP2_gp048 [Pseudomonas phage vB_Pae_AM.P2]QWY17736.1 hypothetical protein [Pseudomonas phage vB_Pae-PA152]
MVIDKRAVQYVFLRSLSDKYWKESHSARISDIQFEISQLLRYHKLKAEEWTKAHYYLENTV